MNNLCANGCGFFGQPSTLNLCSQCYKQFIKGSSSNTVLTAAGSSNNEYKGRCKSCNTKIGLLGFTCKCGGSFCGIHRYPESHICLYDFKIPGRYTISQQNPLCRADKHPDRL